MTSALRPTLLLAALAALAAGCAPRPLTPAATDPRPFGPAWASPHHRDHPLAGRILDVAGRRWVDRAALETALAHADLVILGEVHDNADHHLLQALELRALTAAGRTPGLALEQLDPAQQAKVDAVLAAGGATPEAIAAAVDWPGSRWPPFAIYRPVFEAALEGRMPLVAANLPRATARAMMKEGAAALPEDVRGWLERAPPLSSAEVAAQAKEMAEEHCGELPANLLEPLLLAQRARDAHLAARTAGAATASGAALVAGTGHARTDRAVPAFLARELPGRRILAVAHVEVAPEKRHPDDYAADYGGGALPFDYVVFTPGAEREDPCAKLRRQLAEKPARAP